MVEITDRESAKAWLEDKPREVQVAFAARCALRALPALSSKREILPFLRALLTSGVAGKCPTREMREAFNHCADSTVEYFCSVENHFVDFADHPAAMAAVYAVRSAATEQAVNPSAVAVNFSAQAADRADPGFDCNYPGMPSPNPAARNAVFSTASTDAIRLDTDTPDVLFQLPLWHGKPLPEGLRYGLERLCAFWDAQPEAWRFWREWYQGMLDGQPMDWELQKRVALIPDADWEKGPEHIARRIEEIRARFELEAEIAALKETLGSQDAAIAQRCHNNPPELVEEAEAVRQELTIVWTTLKAVEAEIEKNAPSPSRLRELAKTLLQVATKFAIYCGSLTDAALQAAARELGGQGGKWAARAATAYFVSQIHPVQTGLQWVAELVEKFATLFH